MGLSTAARNAIADAFLALADEDAGTPTAEFATSAAFTTIPLIFNLNGTDAFLAAVAGVAGFNGAPITATASSTGTCTHFRVKDRDGTVITSLDEMIDAWAALMAVGSGVATLEYMNAALTTAYLTLNLNTTPFGASSGGVATANGLPIAGTGAATGTATHFRYKDRNGLTVVDDALPATIDIVSGESYTATSLTYGANLYSSVLSSSFNVTSGIDYSLNALSDYTQPAS